MTDQPPIAGVGFTAGGLRPDLSDIDETLARIEDAGVSHCELPLFAAQLVAGGRVLPDMARLSFTVPPALARFIAPKGSVALDGMQFGLCQMISLRRIQPRLTISRAKRAGIWTRHFFGNLAVVCLKGRAWLTVSESSGCSIELFMLPLGVA